MNKLSKNVSILTYILLLFCSYETYACSCISKANVKNEIKTSDVVIIGKVVAEKSFTIEVDSFPMLNINLKEYTFLIEKKLKGKTQQDTLKIVTGIGNGDCGFKFLLGKKYIVYASFTDIGPELSPQTFNFLFTDICRRTREYSPKEEASILKHKKLLDL